jgi:mannitol 2-dehydrogenase
MTELMATPLATPLNNKTLWRVCGRVALPAYDRSALQPAVVHIGVGGFHRAHQAVYFDELAKQGVTDWGVIGVGIRRRKMSRVLRAQDNLFTVVQRGVEDSTARVVGSMVEYLLLADDAAAVGARLRDPRTKLVTLTITGDGYEVRDPASGGDPRQSIFPLLVDALDCRRRAGVRPFTVLSCDNLPRSGGAARRAVTTLAKARSAELAEWIDREVTFPGSMVDRITPVTRSADRDRVEREFLVADAWPVITEPFMQWVIESDFCNSRPPLESVGAVFVDDVAPYKVVKSRLLNGTHCALGYLGALAGHHRSDRAIADGAIEEFVSRLMSQEVAPLLPSGVPGMDLDEYRRSVVDRLRNPAIGDHLTRLCARGSTKLVSYVLPSLREARSEGRPHRLLALVVAAWLRYLRGTDLNGVRIEIHDPRAGELQALARRGDGGVRAILRLEDIFGDLAHDEALHDDIVRLVAALNHYGVRGAIARVLRGG